MQSIDTDHTLPHDSCLPDLLRAQVKAQPEHTAVVCGKETLTFRELAERSAELAAHLRHLGAALDGCIGLFVEPSTELMVGAWGILFAGSAYVPLSPEYPEERLRYMIQDVRVSVIVCQRGLVARLRELAPPATRIVTLEDAADCARSNAGHPARPALSGRASGVGADDAPGVVGPITDPGPGTPTVFADPTGRPDTGLRPHHLAYVIYTSGSTGKPKGIMIEHRSIVSQMRWMREVHRLDRTSRVLQKTPMSFDAAQWEILAPGCGATVVMGSPGVYRDPEGLIGVIEQHGVTTLQCVPTVLQALVDTEALHRCTSLTKVFSGGEVLSRSLALKLLADLPNSDLINLYGPTECTINASSFTVDRQTVGDGPQAIPIGSPVHNTRFHILDEQRSPVAVGEIGELYISGVQLARGYLRRPELTAERFVDDPASAGPSPRRLYRTGDLAYWNVDGTVHYVGRVDNQIKLRGFRIELDEIRLAIENHDWVKNAAVFVKDDPHSGFQNLIACVELSPKEAALMDQGNHGAHHQSKESKLQVKAQLSNMGVREPHELAGRHVVDLPGKVPGERQRRRVFARKTYRFFEGGDVYAADVLRLLERQPPCAAPRDLDALGMAGLGELLRYFGQYPSEERLLPKYAYASPGALYATQMYVEVSGLSGLRPGMYYYHPVHHRLILIGEAGETEQTGDTGETGKTGETGERATARTAHIAVHFLGKRRAIEPVYKNNIREVLEIETGHMVGLFEEVLPQYGLTIRSHGFTPAVKDRLGCAEEDYYLGTFAIVPYGVPRLDDAPDIYVQAHPGGVIGLPAGQYAYADGRLERIADERVLKKHVIAINQQVYERSSFGVTVVSRAREAWRGYIDLGRTLQRLQMNDMGLGFMSSGYSSRSGNDLSAARRMAGILRSCGRHVGPCYFFVGGGVSEEQVRSEGMKEDTVHMKGPAEMIREDLVNALPDYMVPNRVVVMDQLPLSANGKIDVKALEASELADAEHGNHPFVAPRTRTETRMAALWQKALKRDRISVHGDFFESGGNSLIAVSLVNSVNREFGCSLPLQVLFESRTVEELARRVDAGHAGDGEAGDSSRLVRLNDGGAGNPVYCWPGLGGYPMNLRLLAGSAGAGRPFFGMQAHGINPGEIPYPTIRQMAAADVDAIRRQQPTGPYTLWGYSFGARVAFEAAYLLEQAGERVDDLFLIAPGSPKVRTGSGSAHGGEPSYDNAAYVTILFSVFAGRISGPDLAACLKVARDDESFASFVGATFRHLDPELVKRIVGVVRRTFGFTYAFPELAERRVNAPVTIYKARGDDYSFIENSGGYSTRPPTVVQLEADHYSMLRDSGIGELVKVIGRRLRAREREKVVPHVNIKHFPVSLTEEQQSSLVAAVTSAVKNAFNCDEGVISIALEPVEEEAWNERVYIPEIMNRKELLHKVPSY